MGNNWEMKFPIVQFGALAGLLLSIFLLEGCGKKSTTAGPTLSNVRARACASDFVEVNWTSDSSADSALSFTPGSGAQAKTCSDPTMGTTHSYGDISHCSSAKVPAGSGGSVTPNITFDISVMSRDAGGNLGTATTSVVVPPAACLCLASSGNVSGTCASIAGCYQGFNLETGAFVNSGSGDLYLSVTEDGSGRIATATLNAPQGMKVLASKYLCEVDNTDTTGLATSLTYYSSAAYAYPERTTTFIVRSSLGNLFKVSLECDCPSGGATISLPVTITGLRFGFIKANADGTFSN